MITLPNNNSQVESNQTPITDALSDNSSKTLENKENTTKGEEQENGIQTPYPVFTK